MLWWGHKAPAPASPLPRSGGRPPRRQLPIASPRTPPGLDARDPGSHGDSFLFLSNHPRRPGRAGHYLGSLVARYLAARLTVSDLVALEGPPLRARIVEALAALAAEPAPTGAP